jgi:hypothetical protein
MRHALCSDSSGELHMTPARLKQLADGSQQDMPMTPQAQQSLSHPISHPLHRIPAASRE